MLPTETQYPVLGLAFSHRKRDTRYRKRFHSDTTDPVPDSDIAGGQPIPDIGEVVDIDTINRTQAMR